MKKAVVLGGGIGGVEAAIALRKEGFPVTLVSDRDYLYLYPISIWIPTREIEFHKVAMPLQDLARAHGFEVVVDPVVAIRTAESRVVLQNGEITYDYLVIALGGDKVQRPGQEHTFTVCGHPEGSLQLRARLDELIARGGGRIAIGFGGNPKDQSAVRGGPAFEVAFNIHHYLVRKGLRSKFEMSFFAPMQKPGARMGEKAADTIKARLNELGIHTHFGKRIKAFEPDAVIFEDGSRLESDLIMFIPAGTGKGMLRSNSDLPLTEAGFIKITDHCQVEGLPNVYAVGDVAAIEGPEWRAKQGHLAEAMARVAAFNIAAVERGSGDRKGYKEHISILCVMDTGNGANLVYRSSRREFMMAMPLVGHQLKKAWGQYYNLSKRGRIPRIPGF